MKRFLILNVVVFALCALPVFADGDVETYGDGVTSFSTRHTLRASRPSVAGVPFPGRV